MQWPIVQEQLKLLKMRNACPAFGVDAELQIEQPEKHILRLTWHKQDGKAALEANLLTYDFNITLA